MSTARIMEATDTSKGKQKIETRSYIIDPVFDGISAFTLFSLNYETALKEIQKDLLELESSHFDLHYKMAMQPEVDFQDEHYALALRIKAYEYVLDQMTNAPQFAEAKKTHSVMLVKFKHDEFVKWVREKNGERLENNDGLEKDVTTSLKLG